MHTNLLPDLIKIPSVSSDRKACLSILKHVAKLIPASIHNKDGILIWGHQDLSTSQWLLHTHLDVVPGEPPQFLLRINHGKGWGRGAADAKGAASVLIANAPKWSEIAKEKKITFLLSTDEEVGGESTKQLLAHFNQLKGAIFLEPTNLHLTVEAKGMMQIKITAQGKPVHGSRPWEGENAIEKLMIGITKFRLEHPQSEQETKQTTFNFSLIKGGTAINQVPDLAEIWCDVRFNPQDNPEVIIQDLTESFNNCDIIVLKNESPIFCDQSSILFSSLARSMKENSVNPLTQFDHGTSDARHCAALGIPAIVFGPKGKNLHAKDEWVNLESLDKVSNILNSWLNNI